MPSRIQALFTGLVARGQLRDFERYAAKFGIPCDPIKNELFPSKESHDGADGREDNDRLLREYVNKSLVCTVFQTYIYNAIDEKRLLLLLKLFLGKFGYTQENMMYAMEIIIKTTTLYNTLRMHKAAGIMDIIVQDLDFDLFSCQTILRQLGKKIVEDGTRGLSYTDSEKQEAVDDARGKLFECKRTCFV